jgi:hypothetical protein
MDQNMNIVIGGPSQDDITSYINFLQNCRRLTHQVDEFFEWNPDLAARANRRHDILETSMRIGGYDISLFGPLVISGVISNSGVLVIKSHVPAAQAFCVLAGCGVFVPTPGRWYEFSTIRTLKRSMVIQSVVSLINTLDDGSISHPENIVTCIPTSELPGIIDEIQLRHEHQLSIRRDRRGQTPRHASQIQPRA